MLPAQRKGFILERLGERGQGMAKDVAEGLGVTEDSIRRDLRELAADGMLQRVYGGALPVSPAVADYAARRGVAVDNKARVAARAIGLIEPGSTVILDGGTTTLAIAQQLPPDLEATVVTHSPTVAAALVEHPTVEVFILGGMLFKHSAVASGAAAVEAAQAVNADLFFLGVTGVHPDAGLTTGDADEAAMKRALSRRAADTYVLASAEKIGAASPFTVIGFADVAGIITDAPASDPALARIAEAGVPVLAA